MNLPSLLGAQQLLTDANVGKLGSDVVAAAKELVIHPENNSARALVYNAVENDVKRAVSKKADNPAVLSVDSHRLESVFKEVESPGSLRKVGPSLRYIGSKVGYDFLYDWINNPAHFRPTSKMPRFFGQFDHLDTPELKDKAAAYERAEVQAVTEYLLTFSQKFDYIAPTAGATPDLARGKKVFEVRGCLACHAHQDLRKSQPTRDRTCRISGRSSPPIRTRGCSGFIAGSAHRTVITLGR